MSYTTLLENFAGDPDELYKVVAEEINSRGVPGLSYRWRNETRGPRFFSGPDESVRCLIAENSEHQARILAYQYGTSFYVSLRTKWQNEGKVGGLAAKGFLPYLDEVRFGCFTSLIDRATQAAVLRYLEEVGSQALPEALSPEVDLEEVEGVEETDEDS